MEQQSQQQQPETRVAGKKGGHLFLRNKIWHAAFSLRGKEIRKSTKCTELSEAHKVLAAEMRKVHADEDGQKPYAGVPKMERIKINELLDDLIANYKRNNGGVPREVPQQMQNHLHHVRAHFGDFRAVNLRRHHVESYIDMMRSRRTDGAIDHLQNATINRRTELLYRAFVLGTKADPPRARSVPVIERQDESDNVRKGKFSRHEAELVFLNAPEHLGDYFRWLYECGQRAGEAAGLRWSYLNADQTALLIPGSDCKNREPRIVAVTDVMAEILERRRKARIPGCDLIFHKNGKQITSKNYNSEWRALCLLTGLGRYVCRFCRDEKGKNFSTLDAKKVCRRCGTWCGKSKGKQSPKYIGKTPHDFRRSCAHELTQSGVSNEEAMEVTGHRSASMFKRYSDLFTAEQRVERQLAAQARRAQTMGQVIEIGQKSGKASGDFSGVGRKMLN